MSWLTFLVIVTALINTPIVSTQTKFSRTRPNLFNPVLSFNAYTGHIKENENIVQLTPKLYATDSDLSTTPNGQICGYQLSLHKHDDVLDENTANIPFTVELTNNDAILKLKSNSNHLDCEIKQTYRFYIRAYDCASIDKRRYSERSSVVITVDDVNEHAPIFTHDHYIFKLHQDQTCDASSCRVEATDDDCGNENHRVCGYEIKTANVPFSIDSNGVISANKALNYDQYDFDIVAIDCQPGTDGLRQLSQSAHVTVKIIQSCKPMIIDESPSKLLIQSDRIRLFDTVKVKACEETCNVEDIVSKVELNANGLNSGCNLEQCSTVNREYVLISKDPSNDLPPSRAMSFNGVNEVLTVNRTDFAGHFNNEFTIRMLMRHSSNNADKEHIFCKSDEKLKNRHHTALFIQNGELKLLIRKGPISFNDKTSSASEWAWKVPQINDDQWHSYEFIVDYPNKIELYIDEQLFSTNKNNFRIIYDHPLAIIPGTEGTIFALGACWHARASRMVQYFHGELSGLTIEQKEELQRSSGCTQDCHQYLDIADIKSETGIEFSGNSNRSMWILRADSTESYEKLLKHLVYRNTFQPIGPHGERTVTIQTQIKCLGEVNTYQLPIFTRTISITASEIPVKIELRGETHFMVPEEAMDNGIYLFRNLSIFTNALKKTDGDIRDCSIIAKPVLSNTEQLILPDDIAQDKEITKNGAIIAGVDSIDSYQYILQQVAYASKSPVTYVDRAFTLSCNGVSDGVSINELTVRVHIEKQMPILSPNAAVLSNKLYVDNDEMRDNTFDITDKQAQAMSKASDWPIAVIIFVAVGLAGVLVLYLVIRVRTNNRQRHPISNTNDDIHSQMEWEDDIGLNITVNPLDETKKSVPMTNMSRTMNGYHGSSSDDEEYENDGRNHQDCSSEDDEDYGHGQNHPRKVDHQLEWDDAAIEYGAKNV